MLLLEVDGLEKYIGSRCLFQGLHFKVYKGDRIGLVGRNGSGKSTLLKILIGEELNYRGSVHGSIEPGYLPQYFPATEEMVEEFLLEGQWDYGRIFQLLRKFNLKKEILDQDFTSCSGGEQTRLHLIRILALNQELLLLDEPTNHLDHRMIDTLLGYLKEYQGGLLIVSHDRYFLNEVVQEIWELKEGLFWKYTGDYGDYQKKKEEEERRHWQDYQTYLEEKGKLSSLIKRQKGFISKADKGPKCTDSFFRLLKGQDGRTGQMAKKVKALKSRLGQIEKVKKPIIPKEIRMDLIPKRKVPSSILVEGRGLAKSFGEKRVLEDLDFTLENGAKVALIGHNGVGKTLLLNLIKGDISPNQGEIRIAKGVEVGYLPQIPPIFNKNLSLLQVALAANQELKGELVRTVLGSLLFIGEEVHKKVEVLSIGERVRLGLVCLMVSQANLLLLDEPLNHLDLQVREAVEKSLMTFPGTVLFVTHDRYFIEQVATEIWSLGTSGLSFLKKDDLEYQGEETTPKGLHEETLLGDLHQMISLSTKEGEK